MSSVTRPGRSRSRGPNRIPASPIDQPGTPQITQRTLETYIRLSEQAKAIEKTRLALQHQLETLYATKVDVEPGPLDIQWAVHESKVFTSDKVAEAIGKQDTLNLRQKIAPTITRFIEVVDRTRG